MTQKLIWSFSENLKHHNVKLSDDFKTAVFKGMWTTSAICLCKQVIPKLGTHVVEFNIRKMKGVCVGVCVKDFINQNFEVPFYSSYNWMYLMDQNGYLYMHQEAYKKTDFKFCKNQTISIEVNKINNLITWKNNADDIPSITMNFKVPANQNLYFCFLLHDNTIIELI